MFNPRDHQAILLTIQSKTKRHVNIRRQAVGVLICEHLDAALACGRNDRIEVAHVNADDRHFE